MKRIIYLFFFFCAVVFFWQDLLGIILKGAVRLTMKATLAYRELHVTDGQLVLEDAVLFDVSGGKRSYLLSADTIRIEWEKSFSFFLQLEKTCLTLSSEVFKNRWFSSSSNRFIRRTQIPNGKVDWSDGFLPAAAFSLIDDRLDVSWEGRGTLSVSKTDAGCRIVGSNLPLNLILPKADGVLDGSMDLLLQKGAIAAMSLKAQGKDLFFDLTPFNYGGSFIIDWTATEILSFNLETILMATDRIRFSIEKGSVGTAGLGLITNGKFLGTFQAGLGGKWEGTAETKGGFPLSTAGKAFDGKDWQVAGTGRLGGAEAIFTPLKTDNCNPFQSNWRLEWKGIGPLEAAFIQEFASRVDLRSLQCEWARGTSSGIIHSDLRGKWHCEDFQANDFLLRILETGWSRNLLNIANVLSKSGQVGSSRSPNFALEAECKHLSFQRGNWNVEDLFLKTPSSVEFQGNGRLELGTEKGSLEGILGGSEVRIFYDKKSLFGSVGEFLFDGKIDRLGLSIPRFGGKLPPWLVQLDFGSISSGRISSLNEGFTLRMDGAWSLACKMENGSLDVHPELLGFENDLLSLQISDLQCEMYADPGGLDLIAARGMSALSVGDRSFAVQLLAPRIQCLGGKTMFDVRLVEKEWDFVRVAGQTENDSIEIDPSRSFILGSPLKVDGTVQDWHLSVAVPWCLLESLLKKKGYIVPFGHEFDGMLQFDGSGGRKGESLNSSEILQQPAPALRHTQISLKGIDWKWRGNEIPLGVECSESNGEWSISSFVFGAFAARCQLHPDLDGWLIQKGVAHWNEILSFDFEGKISDAMRLNAVIDQLKVDLTMLDTPVLGAHPIRGMIEGKGCLIINSELEADLDLTVKNLAVGEYIIENSGPLYVSINSAGSAFLKGVECKIGMGDLEAHATTDLLEIDWTQFLLKAKKVRALIPTNLIGTSVFDQDREIVLFGNAEFKMDGSDWMCELQEGFLPFAGSVRHVKDCRIGSDSKSYVGSGRVFHQAQEAFVSWSLDVGNLVNTTHFPLEGSLVNHDCWKGKVVLQESGSLQSLAIDGSYKTIEPGKRGLFIHSVEGEFAGLAASFRSVDDMRLVGSMQIDFSHLSNWIPPAVAEVFQGLEMGAGYELKGHLSLIPGDIAFQGLFCGKDIDLFGFQLRTLMAQADLRLSRICLQDLLISDAAGSLVIPEMIFQGSLDPWTINIPTLTIRDLRPSLLQKPGAEKKALTPLVVRELKLRDFRGLLEDGTTYRASGELSFINSFKRGKSVFDLPTHLFGRIVGLDLELLIPVEGQLFFELDKGYFMLTDLKESFSEGRRSQFFLAGEEVAPRMSLKGDLEIFVKMKQFVLFALTEAFMISIDGKLSDPQFRLQKKKNFL